uniref:Uncharacterized protein n=1 Tax=Lepeophtheirus salmonis TaxID=72036 RepID=A0A0K2UTU1_LEPSM
MSRDLISLEKVLAPYSMDIISFKYQSSCRCPLMSKSITSSYMVSNTHPSSISCMESLYTSIITEDMYNQEE